MTTRPPKPRLSAGHAPSGAVGPLASGLLHAAILVGTGLGPTAAARLDRFDDVVPEGLTFLVPPSASPAATLAQVRFESSGGDDGDATDGEERDDGRARAGTDGAANAAATDASEATLDAVSAGASEEVAEVFQVIDVDSAAVREPTSAAPAYPPALQKAGIEGWAAARFVVDSTGLVDMATVETLGFTAPEFWQSVRSALPQMRFRPAKIGDRPVRQLAEQMFRFEIVRPDSTIATRTPRRSP